MKRQSNLPTFKTFSDKIPYLGVDLKELLSRKVVDTTINEVVFKLKNENSTLWKQFIEELKEYNDLEKIHKTDTKYKSKYGKSIVGFDIWDKHPIIWFADNVAGNDAIRINGQKQWAIICTRTYASIRGTPILKNKLVITSKNTNYLFLSGFGVGIKNKDTVRKINNGELSTQTVKEGWIPIEWCALKIPNYIQEQFRVGAFDHNYGVLPAMEMLNKDFVDSDIGSFLSLDGSPIRDEYFSDWWVANDIYEYFNGFLQFIASEMVYDQTRIIGTFSQQDINNLMGIDKQKQVNIGEVISNLQSRLQVENKETNLVMKKLILKSLGGEGSQLEKMQTTYKALEFTETLDKIISLFFKMSGYSWDGDSAKVYENVSQTLNASKGVYESTKEKIVLFERQWKEFYSKVAYAWFKQQGQPFNSVDEARQEFENNIDFQIVSNVLQQENNDYQKVVELKQNNLISTFKAIRDLNPEMTNQEIDEEISRLDEEKQKQDLDNNFNNMDFMGYEENENPAVDNFGKDFKERE